MSLSRKYLEAGEKNDFQMIRCSFGNGIYIYIYVYSSIHLSASIQASLKCYDAGLEFSNASIGCCAAYFRPTTKINAMENLDIQKYINVIR